VSFPIVDALAAFATGTRYEDVPASIVRQAKNVLLDSIGCALGGATTDPGKIAIAIARTLGGPPECSILGTGDKVSITNAVLANGQLVNTLDFDTVMPGGHTPPYIVPTVLAMAERQHASGRDLVVATAVALELSARIAKAVPPAMSFEGENDEFRYAKREGYARLNFRLLDDSEHGYAEFSGYEGWYPERILPGLGETWSFDEVRFKPYACCTMLHRSIECFEEIVRTNRLHPDEIEHVTAYASPTVSAVLFTDRSLNNIVDLQFGTHNMLAMVAYGERTGVDWQDWNKLTDPKIRAFADRVEVKPNPDFAQTQTSRVEVVTRGQTLTCELQGMTAPLEDVELVEKFRHNAARSLTQLKIDRAVDSLLRLEEVEDTQELMVDLRM